MTSSRSVSLILPWLASEPRGCNRVAHVPGPGLGDGEVIEFTRGASFSPLPRQRANPADLGHLRLRAREDERHYEQQVTRHRYGPGEARAGRGEGRCWVGSAAGGRPGPGVAAGA